MNDVPERSAQIRPWNRQAQPQRGWRPAQRCAGLLVYGSCLLLSACSFGIGVTNAPALDPCDNVPKPQICR